MGCFDYNRAGQLNLQFMLTWKMAHTENLYARHRFELITLILWFYFTIWLGLQMKSQCHPCRSFGVSAEPQQPAVGYLPAFHPFSAPGPCLGSCGRWPPVPHPPPSCCWLQTQTCSSECRADGLQMCPEHQQDGQTSAEPDPFFPPASHTPTRVLVFLVFQLHRIRLLISINSIWKTNQKTLFLR